MSLNILVKSNKIDKYFHNDKYYIEGRKNSTYEIEYTNNTYKRQKVVFSVDGLNVISGNNDWSKGYVVNAGETIIIPGWRKDENNVAKFQFSSVKGSYNQHNDSGDEMNVGVIGALVYDEKYVTSEVKVIHHNHYHNNWPQYQYYPWYNTDVTFRDCTTILNSAGGYGVDGVYGAAGDISMNNVNVNNVGGSGGDLIGVLSNATKASFSNDTANKTRDVTRKSFGSTPLSAPDTVVNQEVGTSWGGNQYFKTSTVIFNAEDKPSNTLTIYYDSRKNLERMGVVFKPIKEREPNAFPGLTDRCPSPK